MTQSNLEVETWFLGRFPRADFSLSQIQRFININIHSITGDAISDYPHGYGRGWHEIVDGFVELADMFWEEG